MHYQINSLESELYLCDNNCFLGQLFHTGDTNLCFKFLIPSALYRWPPWWNFSFMKLPHYIFMFPMNYLNLSVARVNLHIGRSSSVFRPSNSTPSSLIWSKRRNHSTKEHIESWKRRGFYSFSTRGLSNAFCTVKMNGWVTSGPAILLPTGIVLQRQKHNFR